MANILEVIMVVCFGLSWPLNIRKMWISKTAKGSSILFYFFIWIGYIFGIGSKIALMNAGVSTPFYVWFFYILNTLMVTVGIITYFRNQRLDKKRASE